MREAGVNLVSVGIFSWALLEPRRGRVRLRLARPGARPAARRRASRSTWPPRPRRRRPGSAPATREARPVDRDGVRLGGGSPAELLPQLARRTRARRAADHRASSAARYGDAPGRRAVARAQRVRRRRSRDCYCDDLAPPRSATGCAPGTATWTRSTTAWGTAFWGQRYGDWDEIDAAAAGRRPRSTRPSGSTSCGSPPTRCLRLLPRASATSCAGCRPASRSPPTSWPPTARASTTGRWAPRGRRRLQRPLPATPSGRTTTSSWRCAADLTRSLAGGAAVAADGALDQRGQLAAAQHRQAPGRDAPATASPTSPAAPTACCSSSGGPPGSARRSSTRRCCRTPAPTPGSGARWSRSAPTWPAWPSCAAPRVEADVGDRLGLGVVVGARAGVAPVGRPGLPRADRGLLRARCGATTSPSTSPTPRPTWPATALVVAPSALPDSRAAAAKNLRRYVEAAAPCVVSYFSGIVDEQRRRATRARYPGALRDVLGLTVEEFLPLRAGERVHLSDGGRRRRLGRGRASCTARRPCCPMWTDRPPGGPAVTRHALRRRARAWYVSTRLTPADLATLLNAGLRRRRPAHLRRRCRTRSRSSAGRRTVIAINHGDTEIDVEGHTVPAGAVWVGRPQ